MQATHEVTRDGGELEHPRCRRFGLGGCGNDRVLARAEGGKLHLLPVLSLDPAECGALPVGAALGAEAGSIRGGAVCMPARLCTALLARAALAETSASIASYDVPPECPTQRDVDAQQLGLLSKPDGARYRERLDALRIERSGSAHGSPEVMR